MSDERTRITSTVREHYGRIAAEGGSCCGPAASSCCSPAPADVMSRAVGYSEADLAAVPAGANLGLGCGNPVALASLQPGETVLDLGSGAGFDCFLAAERVGPSGRVIGVDMTPAMLERARANAAGAGADTVEFRLGEIEHLPVADASVDVVISNCVVNLSPDKPQVFREALRVLKPGGRLMVSDLVLERELPESVRSSVEAYVGCISGALLKADYLAAIRAAGFVEVEIQAEGSYPIGSLNPDQSEMVLLGDERIPRSDLEAAAAAVKSVKVRARRP